MLSPEERVLSISKPLLQGLLPMLCGMTSTVSLTMSMTLNLKRFTHSSCLHVTPTSSYPCCQAFDTEMQSFYYLFTRYLAERAQSQELWAIIPQIQ
jgi:hypothetical protein